MGQKMQIRIVISIIVILVVIVILNFIDNDNLRTICLQICASLLGGGLTLIGVYWTIKETRLTDEKKKIQESVPLFSFNFISDLPPLDNGETKACFSLGDDEGYKLVCFFQIENSSKNSFILKRIYHDKKWFRLVSNVNVLASKINVIHFRFNDLKPIYLEIEDQIGTLHYYEILTCAITKKPDSYSAISCEKVEIEKIVKKS